MEKRCSKCNEMKDIGEFHQSNVHTDSYFPWCKDCRSEYDKAHGREIRRKAREYDRMMKESKGE